jgi:hypothetical protein
MAQDNKGFKVFMIVINALIWGYALVEVVPLLLGDGDAAPVTVTAQQPQGRRDTEEGAPVRYAPQRSTNMVISDPVALFRSAPDPFRPVLVPVESRPSAGGPGAVPGQRVPGYTIPGSASPQAQPVTTSYRLSGLMEIGGNVVALLTSGAGAGAQAIQAVRGQELPDGSRVREVNFKDNFVIVVKERHVFKLIDYSPWVLLMERP